MSVRLSVTEVRNALRCPRLFTLGRLRGRAVGFPVGSSLLGATFHRVVDAFARAVDNPPPYFAALSENAPRDDIEAALGRWLLERLFQELEIDPTYSSIPAEVDDLAEALRELARHLAGRLVSFEGAPRESIPRLVRSGERPLETPLGTEGTLVHGKLDALFGDPRGVLEVVEYKLTDEANDALDRAQVALYRELLRATDETDARAVVMRFTPTLRETSMSSAEADHLVEGTLKPLLRGMGRWLAEPHQAPATDRRDICSACPLAADCAETYGDRLPARDDPPASAARPRPGAEGRLQRAEPVAPAGAVPADADGQADAERLRDAILAQLKRQGIQAVSPRPPTVGPTLYLIEVARPRGPVRQLDAAADDVRHRLASSDGIDLEYRREGGHRIFVVRRPKPQAVLLGPLLERKREWLSARPGRFILGQKPDGEIVCGDFADASTPHLLIGGQAGSGKSYLLRAIIASLVHFHGPEDIRLTLIDPKRVTFNTAAFESAVGAHLDGPIGYDGERAQPAVEQLIEVMQERYACFERAKVSDLDEYNQQAPPRDRLERKILVIDEFQDLTADKSTASPFFEGVKRLGAKARASGVHLILATQRPDAATVPSIIKANLGGKVALKVASQTNSRIILDQGGAETLLGRGDLLADLGHGLVRAQAAIVQG